MRHKLSTVGIILVMLVLFSPSASATLQMTLSSGGTTVAISDNGAGDLNPAVGQITFIGAVGHWSGNVSTGTVGNNPLIDLNSVSSLGGSAGTGTNALTIKFSGTNFTEPFSSSFLASIGGTLANGHSLSFAAYVDPSNVLYGTGTQIGSTLNFSSPGFFGGNVSGGTSIGGQQFSLTEIITLSGTSSGSSSFNGSIDASVPEPATMALLGAVLLFSGNAIRRKFRGV